jgi:hypothetical protein
MNEHQTSSIIHWYEELEERLIEFLKFFPFTSQNLNVSSPRLAGLITEACNILDSLFNEALNPKAVHRSVIVCQKCGFERGKRSYDITDYAKFYSGTLRLPVVKSFMYVSPPQYVTPFQERLHLLSGGDYMTLPWWSAYTRLKHNRIKNIEQATLANAVNALCGLHQVIAKLSSELGRATLRHGWFQTGGMNPESLLKMFDCTYIWGKETFLVETKLFAVPVGPRDFPDNIADLLPGFYACSGRLPHFLGRYI